MTKVEIDVITGTTPHQRHISVCNLIYYVIPNIAHGCTILTNKNGWYLHNWVLTDKALLQKQLY